MEGDDGQPATGIQAGNGIAHHLLYRTQLIIHRNADGLKAALGRMLFLSQCRRGHGASDNIHQLQRGFDGRFLSAAANGRGDLGCVALLAVIVKDPLQLRLLPAVYHIVGGKGILGIHAHTLD